MGNIHLEVISSKRALKANRKERGIKMEVFLTNDEETRSLTFTGACGDVYLNPWHGARPLRSRAWVKGSGLWWEMRRHPWAPVALVGWHRGEEKLMCETD